MQDDGDLYVVDTDCGGDDAMAIVLAMRKHAKRMLAMTCSYGNTSVDNVCNNVMRTLVVCDETSIPIFRGSSGPLLVRESAEIVHGSDGLGDCGDLFTTLGMEVQRGEFVPSVLSRLARGHPGRITLVCLAPLTNVALTHRMDEEFTKNLKRIVCMGGNYKGIGNTTDTAEFNFYCDPESAHIVVTEAQCPVVLVPWETTVDYGVEWDFFNEMMATDSKKAHFLKHATKVVADYCRADNCPMFYDCDLLAMVAAVYPESVTRSMKKSLAVECGGQYSRGLTVLKKEDTDKMVEIVQDFDAVFLKQIRRDMLVD